MSRVNISIVLLLTLSICSVFSQSCVEEVSGRNGRCVPRHHCREKFDNGPQVCDRIRQTICCPAKLQRTTTTVKPSRISEKKCREYATRVFPTETQRKKKSITRVKETSGHAYGYWAGSELINVIEQTTPLVYAAYGGSWAEEKEFPHMALIGYGEGRFEDYKCGGSLVSEQWVLSAAHCSNGAKHIKLGGLKRLELEPSTKIFRIIENIKYPNYRSGYVDHDIVLFKMNEPVTFNRHIIPICLQQSEDIPNKLIAAGWGKTEYTSGMSPELIKVTLDHLPISSCQSYFENEDDFEGTDFSNIVCAGSQQAKDTCKGDSGSPLQYYRGDHLMYTVTGITAHGSSFCGSSTSGAIYTKVFKYLDWIEGIVWPDIQIIELRRVGTYLNVNYFY